MKIIKSLLKKSLLFTFIIWVISNILGDFLLSTLEERGIETNKIIKDIITWALISPINLAIAIFILVLTFLIILEYNKAEIDEDIKHPANKKIFNVRAIPPYGGMQNLQENNHLNISNKIFNRTTYGIDITNISNNVIENCTVTLEHIEAVYSLYENKIDKGILFGSSQSYRGKLRWKEKEFISNHCEEKLIAGETKTVQVLDSYTIKIDGTYINNKDSISEMMQFVYCSNQTAINEATRLINGLYKIKLRVDGIQNEKYITPYYYNGYIFIKVEQENPNNIKNSTFIGDGNPKKNKNIPQQSIWSKLFKFKK